jgi:hypothetical protein
LPLVYSRQAIRESYSENIPKHTEERVLLNASQFGFRARHSTTIPSVRLTDQVTLNFNHNMSTAVVFFDIAKAFDTTWYLGLPFKLFELKQPHSLRPV